MCLVFAFFLMKSDSRQVQVETIVVKLLASGQDAAGAAKYSLMYEMTRMP